MSEERKRGETKTIKKIVEIKKGMRLKTNRM